MSDPATPSRDELPLPDFDQIPTGSPDARRPEVPAPAPPEPPARPETQGPPVNPPSQGVPTNPAQPRK